MDKKTLAFGGIVVFLVILILLFQVMITTDPPLNNICVIDDDCVAVKADCCECAAGGTQTAINKQDLDKYNQQIEGRCRDVFCTQVISDHWTCSAEPKCLAGICQMA